MSPTTRFHWTTFDVRSLLPTTWREQVMDVALRFAQRKTLVTRHSTSREARTDLELPTQGVGGDRLRAEVPWLALLYDTAFLDFAQAISTGRVSTMSDERFAIALNIQSGADRYECHVDTNPIEGLLYVTTHREGEGGELVVSNLGEVHSIEVVDRDASVVEPKAGHLLFFDGRYHSHYVRPLADPTALRVV